MHENTDPSPLTEADLDATAAQLNDYLRKTLDEDAPRQWLSVLLETGGLVQFLQESDRPTPTSKTKGVYPSAGITPITGFHSRGIRSAMKPA